jgi:hypothetical protein
LFLRYSLKGGFSCGTNDDDSDGLDRHVTLNLAAGHPLAF